MKPTVSTSALLRGLAFSSVIFVSDTANAQQTLTLAYVPFNVPLAYAAGATAANYRTLDPNIDVASGAMPETLRAIAKDTGLKFHFVPMVSGEQAAALIGGKVDLSAASYRRTANIKAAISFTKTAYTYGEGLIIKKGDTRPYKTYQDLRGEVVGAQKGTVSAAGAQKAGIFAAVKLYNSGAELERAVGNGDIKAGFDSGIYGARSRQQRDKSANWQLSQTYHSTWFVESAVGARKADQAILNKIDASLAKLKADGTARAIFAKYHIEEALAK